MARWVTVTADDLRNTKVAALVDALRTAALGSGQTDRSTEIIQNAITRIRDEVQGCKTNHVDVDPTKIPKGLLALASRLILWELKNALELDPTEAEKTDHRDDLDYLRRISRCEVPIEIPDNPLVPPDVQPGAGTPLITARCRKFTEADQEGL